MADTAKALFLVGLGIMVGVPALVLLISLGPASWFFAGMAFILAAAVVSIVESEGGAGDGSDGNDGGAGTNCPSCGAPNDADAERCEYCDAPL